MNDLGNYRRRVFFPKRKVFYYAIDVLRKMFPQDDFTVMNPHVFETVVADMKWSYKLHGFTGAAASLFYDLIMDHPLVDGNKRLASLMLYYYVKKNGYMIRDHDKLYDIAILVAEGKISKQGVIKWLRKRLRKKR